MKYVLLLAASLSITGLFAQEPKVEIPEFKDRYSELVRTLEGGSLDIDYREFRDSFLESEQFSVAGKESEKVEDLRKKMRAAQEKEDHKDLIKITKALLSIDYTDMMAHKVLQQTYKAMGDTVASKQYHDIEFGLLRSITNSGDAKTCATGWHVVKIEEEYFILRMLGAQLKQQSLTNDGCDKMEVHSDDGDRTYYFEVGKVLEMERRMFEGKH